MDESGYPRLYGRRKGKPLRVRKTALMRELLPRISFGLPDTGFLDFDALFPFRPSALWLEIGFGAGEHLAAQAALHPDIGMIGCEFFINGVAGLLGHVDQRQLRNIRIFPGDARLLLKALRPASLDRVYILFADPWPKKRHAERRFVQPGTLMILAHAMRSGAELRLASDDPVLQEWTAMQLTTAARDFTPIGNGVDINPPEDWIATRYEEKAVKAGRRPLYFRFRRTGISAAAQTE